eukprot:619668-Pleurochrysis_carterae.AAC.1
MAAPAARRARLPRRAELHDVLGRRRRTRRALRRRDWTARAARGAHLRRPRPRRALLLPDAASRRHRRRAVA